MFVHNIDPVLLQLGPMSIRYYGLVYVLGFIGLYYALRRLAGLSENEADSLLIYLFVGLFLGARSFFFAFYRPDLFSFTEFFAVWNGGMSFHGALVGLVLATVIWSKKYDHNPWELADVGALIAGSFLFLGRIANFINAEIVGKVTDVSWCVQFPNYDGCRHPAQLYAALKDLVLQGYMLALYRSNTYNPGFLFWMFSAGYAVLRFIVNFYRDDPVLAFGWLQMGHILSIILFVVAIGFLAQRHSADLRKLFNRG